MHARKKGKKKNTAQLEAAQKAMAALDLLNAQGGQQKKKAKKVRGRSSPSDVATVQTDEASKAEASEPEQPEDADEATNGHVELPKAKNGEVTEPTNGRTTATNGTTNGTTNGRTSAAPPPAPKASGFSTGSNSNGANLFSSLEGTDVADIDDSSTQKQPTAQRTNGEKASKAEETRGGGIPLKYHTDVPETGKQELDVEENVEELDEEEEVEEEEEDSEEEDEGYVVRPRRRGGGQLDSFDMETGGLKDVAVGLEGVSVRFGNTEVLSDARWTVKQGERMALVGPNGCGKTTQLKVLLGEVQPEEGSVRMNRPDLKMSLLSQGFVDELDPESTVEEELLKALPEKAGIKRAMDAVQLELEELEEGPERDEAIERLTELQGQSDALGVFALEDRLKKVCEQVGFLEEDLETKVDILSGGWKVRLGLAKIFMQAPDVLLLDEPTNHLDLHSVEWLESFLKRQSELPIVIVSHDREFMHQTCTKIVDTVEGATYSYDCTYADFDRRREERFARWRKEYEQQEKKERELIKYIKVNKSKSNMAQARKRREEELERMRKSDDYVDKPPRFFRRIRFTFPAVEERRGRRRNEPLASMRNVTHGYGDGGDQHLLQDASFSVFPGDKLGIVGNNGVGKSTLLRLLLGEEGSSDGGEIVVPDMNETRYFTQHEADLLPPEKTVMEVVRESNQRSIAETELFDILKQFRFRGERLERKVKLLSGGEKGRLAIVQMMLQPASLLVFDEPTNHLDVPMKETLETSLQTYTGASIVVSHDRWFLSKTCSKIVEIKDGQVVKYDGDYRHYMDSNPDLRLQVEKKSWNGFQIDSLNDIKREAQRRRKTGATVRSNKAKQWSRDKHAEQRAKLLSLGRKTSPAEDGSRR